MYTYIHTYIGLAFPHRAKDLAMTYLLGNSLMAFLYGLIFMNCLSILLRELEVYIHQAKGTDLYIYVYVYAYISIYIYIHPYIYMLLRELEVYIHQSKGMDLYIFVYIYAYNTSYIYLCMHIYVYKCVHIDMYMYIHELFVDLIEGA
jgi:hypothetical protein